MVDARNEHKWTETGQNVEEVASEVKGNANDADLERKWERFRRLRFHRDCISAHNDVDQIESEPSVFLVLLPSDLPRFEPVLNQNDANEYELWRSYSEPVASAWLLDLRKVKIRIDKRPWEEKDRIIQQLPSTQPTSK